MRHQGRLAGISLLAGLLLTGCGGGGDGETGLPPGTLHVTGVDTTGAIVDVRVRPFQDATQVSVTAADNDAPNAYSMTSDSSSLLESPLYTVLTTVVRDEWLGFSCWGCSFDPRFDDLRRKMMIRFPDQYEFAGSAGATPGGTVQVSGTLVFDYDPAWMVMQPRRFPVTPVEANIVVNGEPFVATSVQGFGGLGDGVSFHDASGNKFSFKLSPEGDAISLSYWQASLRRYYQGKAFSFSRVDDHYLLAVDDFELLQLVAGEEAVSVSLDVRLPDVAGALVVTGAGEDVSLSPHDYSLSTTNNVRQYGFTLEKLGENSPSLTVQEEAGVVVEVSLWMGLDDTHACGSSPLPACEGVSLSSDGYTLGFDNTDLSGGITLQGSLTHFGVLEISTP